MKKQIGFLMLSLFFVLLTQAQPSFYGLTFGTNGYGTLSKYVASTNSLTAAYNFANQDHGSAPVDLEFVQGGTANFMAPRKKVEVIT
jgi:hypothetical protein